MAMTGQCGFLYMRFSPRIFGKVVASGRRSVTTPRLPDAVQRASGAPLIRDRSLTVVEDPGSAAHHFVLRCARETGNQPSITELASRVREATETIPMRIIALVTLLAATLAAPSAFA